MPATEKGDTMDAKTPCRVRWSNGSVTGAATWQELLDKVRQLQWWDWSEENFRMVLAKRADRWSNTTIDFDAPADELFRELQRAGLVEILGQDDNDREEV
jgi:hypothetical protein